MRTKKYFLFTLRKSLYNNSITSHQLMIRSGMIRQVSSGIYNWLPNGIRVLKKIKKIIRKNMSSIGAIELFMPIVQPKRLWKESNRWSEYGSELLRFVSRDKKDFVLGPTHEEIITNLIRNEIISYKSFPINFYQIQTKFRDEIRTRFGVIRSKEFIMKDAYSFHTNKKSLKKTYEIMHDTYCRIFSQIGLKYKIIKAENGTIGGKISHEFQALSKNGETKIVFSNNHYCNNIENTECFIFKKRKEPKKNLSLIEITQKFRNINEIIKYYNWPINKVVKIILVHASKKSKYQYIALAIRADHKLNKNKAEKNDLVLKPLQIASYKEIKNFMKISPIFIGLINLKIPIIIDRSVSIMNDFISGSNLNNKYYTGINWKRDLIIPEIQDLRNANSGDLLFDGKTSLTVQKSIEVGHIFQLGTKYSKSMNAKIQCNDGIFKYINMGCYGIGITRLIAAFIEQNHDKKGIIWNENISPFHIAILPINLYNSNLVQKKSEKIYKELKKKKIEVLLDDRKEHIGIMFSDIELIGIPHIIIISEKNLKNNKIEYQNRKNQTKNIVNINKFIDFFVKKINN
ncbi:MAG: proline--tRNA ligase [Arsenophonus sp.]|nr:MAG: proline--tRNA ligase [Arsenophonus sp.]